MNDTSLEISLKMSFLTWTNRSLSMFSLILLFLPHRTQGLQNTNRIMKLLEGPYINLHASSNELDVTHASILNTSLSEEQDTIFATPNNTKITAQTGSTGILPCKIYNMNGGIVSWIRRKDYHLLTVGVTTYSSDERYQTIHYQHTDDWPLHVKFSQKRDEGIYECQVSSHPPMSIFINLQIVEARAHIAGPTEKYLKPGSALQLQCIILKTTEKPSYVFWYHNDRMINYDTDRGVNVTTDFVQRISDLYIGSTKTSHTGNYSCVPNNARSAKVVVHIFNGENPAAMQSSSPTSTRRLSNTVLFLLFLNLFLPTNS